MNVNGKTKITGIFGHPVGHTLSPAMHNAAFRSLGLNMCYIAFDVLPKDLPDAVKAVKSLNLLGVNITVPHKENVIPLLDDVNAEAKFMGAVNTVVNSEGKLTGYNTDGLGFMSSLAEAEISSDGKTILIIGAGGASRAISYYLSRGKATDLLLYDIDRSKVKKLADDLNISSDNKVSLLDDIENIGKPDIIINATPLGLNNEDPLPLDPGHLNSETVVYDLVYKNTKFLREAKKKGAKTLDGSGMLLWQGVEAFRLWTGVGPPVDVMRQALLSGMSK
ncbi:shikimate dehydrogenase [bacterium BMS3Bbin08]|nr:shikimate dehydrogenase [bacterium BMS3Bbin08]